MKSDDLDQLTVDVTEEISEDGTLTMTLKSGNETGKVFTQKLTFAANVTNNAPEVSIERKKIDPPAESSYVYSIEETETRIISNKTFNWTLISMESAS